MQFRKNDIESKQFKVKSGTLTLIYNTGWKIIETNFWAKWNTKHHL